MSSHPLTNSGSLLSEYPFLEQDPGWRTFVDEFDRPQHVKKRMQAIRSFQKEPSASVKELESHCRTILSKIAAWCPRNADGTREFLTRDEAVRVQLNAAEELAKKVKILLSPEKEGNQLRYALGAEAKRREIPRSRQDKGSPAAIVCFAFLYFVRREERLPSKRELNVEANRLSTCELGGTGKRLLGEVFPSGREKFVVYDNISHFDFGEEDEIKWEFRVVRAGEWDKLKWQQSSGLAEYTTPHGLKGLREAHEDKGGDRKRTKRTS